MCGGGFLTNTEDVTSIPAVFSLTLPFMVCVKSMLLGVRCPEESSALYKARLKCSSYAIPILGIFQAIEGNKIQRACLNECTM